MAKATANARRVGAAARDIDTDETFDDAPVNNTAVLDAIESQMEKDLSQEAKVELLPLSVPLRDRFTILYRPVIDFDTYNAWIKKARDKKGRGGEADELNYLKMAMMVLSNTCVQIVYQGHHVKDEDGDPMTFVSTKLHGMLPDVPRGAVAKAIRAMYLSDGHCIQAMHKVLEASGYSLDGDVEEVDPLEID